MSRKKLGPVTLIWVLVAAVVGAAAAVTEVVTNPSPALTATMELMGASGGVFFWNVRGKVKPAYRGFGTTVKLVCQRYDTLESGGVPLVFGGPEHNVDPCGNFSFTAPIANDAPQLDPSWACFFVAHVDTTNSPQACNGRLLVPDAPADPNGTAPCAGGLCPDAP
jgi:hypothetical protein